MTFFLQWEAAFYWLWWLCFIGIGFCFARCFGPPGLFVALVVISCLIIGIEVQSVFKEMREYPESGRDADFVFWFGVLLRIGIYNALVLPFGFVGLRLRDEAAASHTMLPPPNHAFRRTPVRVSR